MPFQPTHGLLKTHRREYNVWQSMRQRCMNPNAQAYARYGGRGITVCDRWRDSFASFIADMGKRPAPNLTLERLDNNRGYSPDNCAWVTMKVQAQNRRPSQRNREVDLANLRRGEETRRLKPQSCAHCKAMFTRWGGARRQRFCSRKCYGAANKRPDLTCHECGRRFHPARRVTTAKFCDKACFLAARVAKRV